ncbi:hypothetical protein [Anaplasma marginale]|uniref:hypothetical protein n=1 Tax=Anaplasma marginale TaxID=770 RepID=UPI0016811C2C|nr:hypothetical protein [Anaplasma marginale]
MSSSDTNAVAVQGGVAGGTTSVSGSTHSADGKTNQLKNTFASGKVQDIVQEVLCSNGQQSAQILAHVSTRSFTGSRGGLRIDKRYVARVTSSDGSAPDQCFYVHLAYKLIPPHSGQSTEYKAYDVQLGVRNALSNKNIVAPSGRLVLDTMWKPESAANASESTPSKGGSSDIYVHDAIIAPNTAFESGSPSDIIKLDTVDLTTDVYGTLLTDAYVYQNTTLLHKDAQYGGITSDGYDAVMKAVAETLYYADAPDKHPALTRLAEHSILHRGTIKTSGSGHDALERHYVFRVDNAPYNVHAFVSYPTPKRHSANNVQDPKSAPTLAVRLVHAQTFTLSPFLAASCSAATSAEKQQFAIHGSAAPRSHEASEQNGAGERGTDTGTHSPSGNDAAATTHTGADGAHSAGSTTDASPASHSSTQPQAITPPSQAAPIALPIIVVNDYERDLQPISSNAGHVEYLKRVTEQHAVSADMNAALIESLVRITYAGKESLERADASFVALLQGGNIQVNGNVLTADANSGSSDDVDSALSALRRALKWKPGIADLLLRAIINTCDTTSNGFTVVHSDGNLSRIQPTITQTLKLCSDPATHSKVTITRNLQLEYKIGDHAFKTSVNVGYKLSLNTREDGRAELAIENICATAAPILTAGHASSKVLSYPWCKDSVVSDLSQLLAAECAPSLAVSAFIGQRGLWEGMFLKPSSSGGSSKFEFTRNAAKESISEFFSGSGSTTLSQISDGALRSLVPPLSRRGTYNALEISGLFRAVAEHFGITIKDVTEQSASHPISGQDVVGVTAGTRVKRIYKISPTSSTAEDIFLHVEYDVLLVETESYSRSFERVKDTDYVICNLKVGCAKGQSGASSCSMMEFPVPATVSSSRSVVASTPASKTASTPATAPVATTASKTAAAAPTATAATTPATTPASKFADIASDLSAGGTPEQKDNSDISAVSSKHGENEYTTRSDTDSKRDTVQLPVQSLRDESRGVNRDAACSSSTESEEDSSLWMTSGQFRNAGKINHTLNNREVLRAVLFPKKVDAEHYTSHVISRMAQICVGWSNATSPTINNISSNVTKLGDSHKSYKVTKAADVSVDGDVLSISVEYKISKKRRNRDDGSGNTYIVYVITNAKLTIKKRGGAAQAAIFSIPDTRSKSVLAPYQNAKTEYATAHPHKKHTSAPKASEEKKVKTALKEETATETLQERATTGSREEGITTTLEEKEVTAALKEEKATETLKEERAATVLEEKEATETLKEGIATTLEEEEVTAALKEEKATETLEEKKVKTPLEEEKATETLKERATATSKERATAKRKASKWVENTVFVVESAPDDHEKKERCFIVVWFWWFVGLLLKLWACIVAAALWCYNLILRCCCCAPETADNTSTVNLRDFAALKRTKQQPRMHGSGVEELGSDEYTHLFNSPIDDDIETREDARTQQDIGASLAAVSSERVGAQKCAPGSVLDDSEVASVVTSNYSAAMMSGA